MLIPILTLALLVIGYLIISFIILPLKKIKSYRSDGVTTYFFPGLGYLYLLEKSFRERGDMMAYSKEHQEPHPNRKFLATHINRTPLFVLQGHQYTKEFLQNPQFYVKTSMLDTIKPLAGTGLVLAEGETWKRHRRVISTSFNFEFLKTNISLIHNTTREFFDRLSLNDYKSYSVIPNMQEITGEIVGRIFFGANLSDYTFEGKSLTVALNDISVDLSLVAVSPFYVIFGSKLLEYPVLPQYKRLMQRVQNFRRRCLDIIQDRKAKPLASNTDLLSLLLVTQLAEDPEQRFSDEDIVNEFITFFSAGMDTTAHLVAMALYNLTQYPQYIEQLQAEREETYNKDQILTSETLHKMNILHSFLKETLRFHTPAPMPFIREAVQDHTLIDLKVKKGDLVFPDFQSSAFDEKLLKDPKEFDPTRWTNPDLKIDPYVFVPFSAGPRNCIGQHLAMIESKIIVSEFLERFDFDLKEGYKLRMKWKALYEPEDELIFTLKPKTK